MTSILRRLVMALMMWLVVGVVLACIIELLCRTFALHCSNELIVLAAVAIMHLVSTATGYKP